MDNVAEVIRELGPDVDALLQQPEAEQKEEFHITDESSANWYLRQIANLEAEVERVQAQAASIVKSLRADANRLHGLYAGELEQWTRQELEKSKGKRKSLKLLQGTLAFRTVPGGLRVVDPLAALAFVKGQPCEELVSRRVLVNQEYLAYAEEELKISGELWDGVEVVPERESFSVRFGKSKEGKEEEEN